MYGINRDLFKDVGDESFMEFREVVNVYMMSSIGNLDMATHQRKGIHPIALSVHERHLLDVRQQIAQCHIERSSCPGNRRFINATSPLALSAVM
jgi:hypothetical protein